MQSINHLVKCKLSCDSEMSLVKTLTIVPAIKLGCRVSVLYKLHWIAVQESFSKEFNLQSTDYTTLKPSYCTSIKDLEH